MVDPDRSVPSLARGGELHQTPSTLNITYGGDDAVLGGSGRDEREHRLVERNHPVGVRRPHPIGVMSARRLSAMVRSVVRCGPPAWPAADQRRDRQMTEDTYSSSGAHRAGRETSGTAVGFILFAAIMMIMVGVFQALQGLIAIFENEFYVATRNYLFQFDATTWGWIHLVVGLLVAFAGWGLLSGRTWARVVALTLALLSAITNFLFVPYYPFWALLLITLDIFVIWAIAAHGGDMRDPV
jgi:hypothetical protein